MEMDMDPEMNLGDMVETIIKEEPEDQNQELFRTPQFEPVINIKTELDLSINFIPEPESSSSFHSFNGSGMTIRQVILKPEVKTRAVEIVPHEVQQQKVVSRRRTPDYYVCMICSTGIPNAEALKNHDCLQQKGPKPNIYACEHCPRVFAHPANLKRHETVHQDNNKYEILLQTGTGSGSGFLNSPSSIPRKRRGPAKKDPLSYFCKYCSAEFKAPSKLARHESVHERKYICPVCSIEFPSSMSWKFHVEKTHGFGTDGEASASLSTLSENSANGECQGWLIAKDVILTRLPESGSSSGSISESGLNRRTNISTEQAQTPEPVPEEDIPFNMETFMAPQVELKEEQVWTCETCHKTFPDFTLLQQHGTELCGMAPIVANPDEFQCHICPLSFRLHYDLMKHLDIHSSQKPFQCPQCPSKFSRLQCLTRHSRIHGPLPTEPRGPNVFPCTYCKESFTQRATFIKHQLIHTGERPYECSYCQARFRLTSHLNRHVLLHTGQKSFVCKYCPERFTQSISLVCHERKHTGERPFACRYCPSRFRLSAHCKRHEQAHEAKGETEILLSLRMDMNENEDFLGIPGQVQA